MEQLFALLIFLGYFILVLGVASACGLIGYFVGIFLGMGIALLLYPLIGAEPCQFLVGLFGVTGYCLGCVFGAVLTISQISRRRPAPGAEGDIIEEPSAALEASPEKPADSADGTESEL